MTISQPLQLLSSLKSGLGSVDDTHWSEVDCKADFECFRKLYTPMRTCSRSPLLALPHMNTQKLVQQRGSIALEYRSSCAIATIDQLRNFMQHPVFTSANDVTTCSYLLEDNPSVQLHRQVSPKLVYISLPHIYESSLSQQQTWVTIKQESLAPSTPSRTSCNTLLRRVSWLPHRCSPSRPNYQ